MQCTRAVHKSYCSFITNCWFQSNYRWSTHHATTTFMVKGKLACAQSKICTWLHLSQLLQYIWLIWLQLPLSLMQTDIKKSMSPKHCSLFALNTNYLKILVSAICTRILNFNHMLIVEEELMWSGFSYSKRFRTSSLSWKINTIVRWMT